MTIQTGDLPDWQTITSANFSSRSIGNQGANVTAPIIVTSNPMRLWAVWIRAVYASTAAYALGGSVIAVTITDTAGQTHLRMHFNITQAKDKDSGQLCIPMYGVPIGIVGGLYEVDLVTTVADANTALHADGGVVFSQP